MRNRSSPAGPRSVPGRQRVGAAIAMGTRDDEYDYLFKGTCPAGTRRRTAPGSAGTSAPRGPGAFAAALLRGAALWAPGLVWRWGSPGGNAGEPQGPPRPVPGRAGRAPAAGRLRSPGAARAAAGGPAAGWGCAGACPEIVRGRAGVSKS